MLLYQGDFLPEERYWTWVDLKREELRTTYIGLLCQMAELLEKQGRAARKVIEGKAR